MSTATTAGARDHARAMAGTTSDAMPTMPPSAAVDLPAGVDPATVVWDEVVAGGGYTALRVAAGTHVRLTDRDGAACAGLLLHRPDQPSERLNVADTVKVQWQAYLGPGALLLSDMGRVLAAIVEDTSGRHDALCGTTRSGRDQFALALAKAGLGLDRRDVAPNINLFAGVRVAPDGALVFDDEPGAPGAYVELRAELPLLVTIVDVPHPLRPDRQTTPLRVTAWRGVVAAPDDPVRLSTPERERAYLNSEVVR
jgi:uncharacterized protein YcgI (DUF1989 family)